LKSGRKLEIGHEKYKGVEQGAKLGFGPKLRVK
jgi:hypothetical protein